MIKHKDHFHGSDLEKIEEIYGIKKEEIVSFSANVNPLGVSPLLKHTLSDQIDAITRLLDGPQLGAVPLLVADRDLMALEGQIGRHEDGRSAAADDGRHTGSYLQRFRQVHGAYLPSVSFLKDNTRAVLRQEYRKNVDNPEPNMVKFRHGK